MKNFLGKIEEFFVKKPVNEDYSGDSMEQMGLLRKCDVLYVLYYFALGMIIGICNGFEHSVVAFIVAGLMLCIGIATYYSGKLYITMLGATVIALGSVLLESQTSGDFGAGLVMLSVIPLMFSGIRLDTKAKVAAGIVVTALHLAVAILNDIGISFLTIVTKGYFVSKQISQVTFVIIIMLVSYHFCKQYTQAEHQVYVINRQLKKMASLDPLTGLMNRRGMSDVLPDMEYAYKEGSAGLSIAIGDIDFFKKVNDTYGHDCGDYVLKTVSSYFAKYMEDKGEICRWGGEEFLFAFSDKNADDVFVMLNDMRHTIKHMQFKFNDIEFKVTMTFGLEEYTPYAQLDSTIKKADEKLYLGKESGRDKVVY